MMLEVPMSHRYVFSKVICFSCPGDITFPSMLTVYHGIFGMELAAGSLTAVLSESSNAPVCPEGSGLSDPKNLK